MAARDILSRGSANIEIIAVDILHLLFRGQRLGMERAALGLPEGGRRVNGFDRDGLAGGMVAKNLWTVVASSVEVRLLLSEW